MLPHEAYSNAKDDHSGTAAELRGDVLKGRLLRFTERSDP